MNSSSKATRDIRLIGLGDLSPREYRLGAMDLSVGSGRENDLVIAHPTVSRKHAIIGRNLGAYTVADLESTDGTFVNGRRISRPVSIKPGDKISFGAAQFAMLEGAKIASALPARPASSRILAAAGAVVLFAIAGFVCTRYALYLSRIERSNPPLPHNDQASKRSPATPVREATEAAAGYSIVPAAPAVAEDAAPIWLKNLNDFRSAVNLAPVRSDPKLSAGDREHALYVMKNFASEIFAGGLGAEVHTEDPARPWYTPEGAEAARTSDITERGVAPGKAPPDPQQWAIAGWMTAPFHRLFMLSPLLHDVGFGSDCEANVCVALLNVLSGADPLPRTGTPLEQAILFPPDGASIPSSMAALDTEWPNPLSGCDGYAFPAGLPISVQLGPMVDAQLNSFSIATDDGAALEACGFDADSYRNPDPTERARVIGVLRGQGAIVIVPRRPLEPGTHYNSLVSVNGYDYKWSFEIAH